MTGITGTIQLKLTLRHLCSRRAAGGACGAGPIPPPPLCCPVPCIAKRTGPVFARCPPERRAGSECRRAAYCGALSRSQIRPAASGALSDFWKGLSFGGNHMVRRISAACAGEGIDNVDLREHRACDDLEGQFLSGCPRPDPVCHRETRLSRHRQTRHDDGLRQYRKQRPKAPSGPALRRRPPDREAATASHGSASPTRSSRRRRSWSPGSRPGVHRRSSATPPRR